MAGNADLTLVKVGGSLSERANPEPVLAALRELAEAHPLLIVPGGAEFAETVRRATARFGLSDPTAHHMALLAMDQYGLLLAELGGGVTTSDPRAAVQLARQGRLVVLLPGQAALRAPLPASWTVTSDSVAAWLAGELQAKRLLLVKDVDGLLDRGDGTAPRLLPRARAGDCAGVVDEAFARWLPPGVTCWIINGRRPERLRQLLERGTTVGTEVLS